MLHAQVTPDGQRTMRTSLSASKELTSVAQLPGSWLAGCTWLHCEGYCLYRPQFTRDAMSAAKAQHAQVRGFRVAGDALRSAIPKNGH